MLPRSVDSPITACGPSQTTSGLGDHPRPTHQTPDPTWTLPQSDCSVRTQPKHPRPRGPPSTHAPYTRPGRCYSPQTQSTSLTTNLTTVHKSNHSIILF